MESKIVLITGGSSGIGKAIGLHLASKGFVVYGTTRNLANHTEFDDFRLLEMDVRSADSIQQAIGQVLEEAGKLDVLINNAGIGITGPIEETPLDEIKNTFSTNLYGPILMCQAVLPPMRDQGSGLIINITSIAGYMGLPYRGVYSASKGALALITEALRMETKGFGVQMVNLAPGDFATNIASGRYHAPVREKSAYAKHYGKTLELINEHVDDGNDPVLVAEKVYGIIQTQRPKVHYKVGSGMERFSIFLKRILPDKLYERLVLNHYKL